ncbi:MAG: Bax inhibitor-1/YccA family protein [Akkermansia sp.]|nr:Bax inhibitor-1/YccA family protein [Akkermansia sp.]
MNQDSYPVPTPVQGSAARAKAFLNKVYMWLAVSMLITAGVAAYSAQDMNSLIWVTDHRLLLCLSTLGLVVIMSFAANKLSVGAITALLLVFAALQGLLFGPILISYGLDSVGKAFGCTAAMFGAMSIYGTVTKRNLSTLGRTLFMLLIGLIVAMIINIFWGNGVFDTIICCAGVLIFAVFTAYDTQNLLKIGLSNDTELQKKAAVLGALELYLDFINLFVYLLRLLGRDE